jgi:hypothetical protein
MREDDHSTDVKPSSQLRIVGAVAGVGSGIYPTAPVLP